MQNTQGYSRKECVGESFARRGLQSSAAARVARVSALSLLLFPCIGQYVFQFSGVAAQRGQAEAHSERGLQLAQTGELQSAEEELRKAVALRPGSAEFLSNLGTVLAMQKKLEESTTFFERSLKINPGDLRVRGYLAANLWQLRRYAEAKKDLRTILEAKPGDPQATMLLGMVSENSGDYAASAKMLASVPALVREHPESIAALARSYYHLSEREKAGAWLEELKNHPAGPQAVLLGAQIADEMEDYPTAETLLLSLIPGFPDQDAVSYRLALVKFHAKKFEESGQILQQLLDRGQKTGEIFRLLGWSYQEQNRPEEAVRVFREAVQLDPTEETNYLDLGKVLLAAHRLPQALELAKRTVGAFPDSPRALLLKGSVDLATEQFTDAVDSYSRALHLDSASADATIGLAKAQAGAGMTEQAKTTLEGAIRRFSEKATFEVELALLLLKEDEAGAIGARARAEQLLNSAVAHDSTHAEAHYHLGDLALRSGQTAQALAHLEKAAKLAPKSARTHFALARAYRRVGRSEDAARETDLYDKLVHKESQRASPSPAAPSSR